jgi:LysM repeat protein
MAAKKGKTTRKYKQAKQAAKPAAKAAFSGKVQASRKDPKIKISAEDKLALDDMKKTAKADLGKNAYLSRAEYDATQAKAREAFRESMRTEFGEYGGKKASATEAAMKDTKIGTGEKPSVKKKSAPKKKAAVKKAAPSKPSAPATSKSATVAEPTTKPAKKKPSVKKKAATKPSTKKVSSVARPTDASLTKLEDDYITKTREKLIKEGKLSGSKEIAIRPKGEVVAKPKPVVKTSNVKAIPGSDTVVKKGSKLKKVGKGGLIAAVIAAGMDLPNYTKSAKEKAQAEIDLYAAKNKGKNPGIVDRLGMATKGLPAVQKQVLKYFTMGLAGEDMSVSAAKAKKELAKYKATEEAKTRKFNNKNLRYGPNGESLVPGTDAWKKGSKTRPAAPGVAGGTKGGTSGGASSGKSNATPGAGGSTITATPGSTYTVKSGDTLSAIAKASGVSLSEIRKANKKFTTNPKYKQGSMIWSGTKVNIPKK